MSLNTIKLLIMQKIIWLLLITGSCLILGCNNSVKNYPETNSNTNSGWPSWVEDFIDAKTLANKENPAASISYCIYNNKTVYYVPAACCDLPSNLYDENKSKICSPDGGSTGQGDGKCSDFSYEKNDCQMIWQDNR